MTETIKHIAKVYLHLVEKPITDIDNQINGLVNQVSWYLSFFWVAFSKTKKFHFQHADEACDVMTWVGLLFYVKGHNKVTKTCVKNISSIIGYYSDPKHSHNSYNMADLFVFLWQFRLLAETKNDNSFMEELDKHIAIKPDALTETQWKEVLSAFELRKEQLNERLNEIEDFPLRENSESILKEIIRQKREPS